MANTPPESAKLCYVENGAAYFTKQDLEEQWGDDWDDAPYEHNAGRPYDDSFQEIDYTVWRVKFDSYLDEPREGHLNSPYSVEDINTDQAVPWLSTPEWDDRNIKVWAGSSFSELREAIEEVGGQVYTPIEKSSGADD